MIKDPAFTKEDINSLLTNTTKRVCRNNAILNLIKENAPISVYDLSKLCEWSYTEVCRVIRDLEFCGLIQIKVVLENNRAKKILNVPKVGEDKNE